MSIAYSNLGHVPSSLMLGSGLSRSPERAPAHSWSWGGCVDNSSSLLGPKLMRLRGFSSSTRARRAQHSGASYRDQCIFTPSEEDLIVSAREDIICRRQFGDGDAQHRQLVFIGVGFLTLAFPLIGLLAICGKFDQTICWYTHGEVSCFTARQRACLKWELVVQGVTYPVLITVLAVYFAAGV